MVKCRILHALFGLLTSKDSGSVKHKGCQSQNKIRLTRESPVMHDENRIIQQRLDALIIATKLSSLEDEEQICSIAFGWSQVEWAIRLIKSQFAVEFLKQILLSAGLRQFHRLSGDTCGVGKLSGLGEGGRQGVEDERVCSSGKFIGPPCQLHRLGAIA